MYREYYDTRFTDEKWRIPVAWERIGGKGAYTPGMAPTTKGLFALAEVHPEDGIRWGLYFGCKQHMLASGGHRWIDWPSAAECINASIAQVLVKLAPTPTTKARLMRMVKLAKLRKII